MTSKRKGKTAEEKIVEEKTAASARSKGPGRPPGSPNKTYLDAKHIPAACPACLSTNLKAVRGSDPIVKELAGVDANGFAYSKIRWQRSVCDDCDQHVTVRTYFPAKENA